MIINWDSEESVLEEIQSLKTFKKDKLYFVSCTTIARGLMDIDTSNYFFSLYIIPDYDYDPTAICMEIQEMMNDGDGFMNRGFYCGNVDILSWKHIDISKKYAKELVGRELKYKKSLK